VNTPNLGPGASRFTRTTRTTRTVGRLRPRLTLAVNIFQRSPAASVICGCISCRTTRGFGTDVSKSNMSRWLKLWGDPRPRPMITYDEGLPSLPDDIINEIFSLLNMEALKSCSLTGKALASSAKPFIHRTLYITSRSGDSLSFNIPGRWNKYKELPALGKRGLLQHTRHLSIAFPHDPVFAHDLRLHTRHLHTLTILRSFKTRWLDIPSFIPKMEECFGAFLGTLRSLELESPRGDHEQILYFICQFPNLRDLRIDGVQGHPSPTRNGGPHFDTKTSPPPDGTLDLQFGMELLHEDGSKGAQLLFANLVTLPSGLGFRLTKLPGCIGYNFRLLVDACAPTLERMEITGRRFGAPFLHGGGTFFTSAHTISLSGDPRCRELSPNRHSVLRELEIELADPVHLESASRWLSKALSTITSIKFTGLTFSIPLVPFMFRNVTENELREWNSVDNALGRLSLCVDVTLIVRSPDWVTLMVGSPDSVTVCQYKEVMEKNFPSMWETGKVALEVPPMWSV